MSHSPSHANRRIRHSAVYVPANKARWAERAAEFGANVIILDLEDALPSVHRDEARAELPQLVAQWPAQEIELVVRINPINTSSGSLDLEAVLAALPAAVLLPKVTHPGEIESVRDILRRAGVPIEVWAMIETAAAVDRLEDILESLANGVAIVGLADLAQHTGLAVISTNPGLLM